MGDVIIISSVIVSILTALGGILLKLHINKCKCGNINCECDNQNNNENNNENNNKKSFKKKISEIFKNTSNTSSV